MAVPSILRKEQEAVPSLKVAYQLAASAEFDLARDILAGNRAPGALLVAAGIALRMSDPKAALKSLRSMSGETPAQGHLRAVLQSVAEARMAQEYQDVSIPPGASESTRLLGLYYRGMQQAKFDQWEESKQTATQLGASETPSLRCLGELLEAYYETHLKNYDIAISRFAAAFESLEASSENDEWIRTAIVAGFSSLVVETLRTDCFELALRSVATLTPTRFTRRRAADSFSNGSQIQALAGNLHGAYDMLLRARSLALDDSPTLASIEIDLAGIMAFYGASEVANIHRGNAKRILTSYNWRSANADDRLALVFYAIESFKIDRPGASKALTLALSRSELKNAKDLLEHDERASILAKFAEALILSDRNYDDSVKKILDCQKRWISIGYKYRAAEAGRHLLSIGYSDGQELLTKLLRLVPRSSLKSQVKQLKAEIASPITNLSPAEKRVAEGICEGLTSKQIAEKLDRSPATIRNQTISVYRQLGVSTRSALVALMKDSGAA